MEKIAAVDTKVGTLGTTVGQMWRQLFVDPNSMEKNISFLASMLAGMAAVAKKTKKRSTR